MAELEIRRAFKLSIRGPIHLLWLALLVSGTPLRGDAAGPALDQRPPAAPLSGRVITLPSPGDHHDIAPSLQAAVNDASSGDTILLPAGEFYLDGRVVVNKFVSLVGRGRGPGGTKLYRREEVSDAQLQSWRMMFEFRCYSDQPSYIVVADIYFKGQEPSLAVGDGGSTAGDYGLFMGRCVDFVIARNRFEHFGHGGVWLYHRDTLARGVVAENEFVHNLKVVPDDRKNTMGYGVVLGGEDAVWVPDPRFGSDNFIFIEDNTFIEQRHAVAGAGGGLYVFRKNRVLDNLVSHAVDAHGGGHPSNTISTRAMEVYENEIVNTVFADGTPLTEPVSGDPCYRMSYAGVTFRGGEGLIYDNHVQGFRHGIALAIEYNVTGSYPVYTQIGYRSGLALGPSHRGTDAAAADGDVFVWGNTFTPYPKCTWGQAFKNARESLLVEGRDYHLEIPKPGYTPYPYPHPLRRLVPGADPSRPAVEVQRAPGPIIVDGRFSEYPPPPGMAFSDDSGRGAQDNRTSVRLLWDEVSLYLAVQVTDTQLHADVIGQDGRVWEDDAVEVFIDPRDDGGPQFGADDYRIAVNLLDAVMDSRGSWNDHQAWDGNAQHRVRVEGTLNDDRDVDRGYLVELAIPWADLGLSPAEDLRVGLDVGVDDRDGESGGYQYSDWAGLMGFNQPWGWGRATLRAQLAAKPTFADVLFDHPYHDQIEALYQTGYTAGCGADPLRYCPDQAMTRSESAVFVERGLHGVEVAPPDPVTSVFEDVQPGYWGLKWATALWGDGYTAGCGADPLRFCPERGHTRAEGAVFTLRMLHGADYIPPDPQGIFADVPVGWWGAKWAEEAYGAGLIPSCGEAPLRFCPDDPLTRGLAASMMVKAKGLSSP